MVQVWKPDTCSCEFETDEGQENLINARAWCELHLNSGRTDAERFENAKRTCRTKNKVDAITRAELKVEKGVKIPFTIDTGGVVHIRVKGSRDKIRKLQARLNSELHPLRPVLEVIDE